MVNNSKRSEPYSEVILGRKRKRKKRGPKEKESEN